MKYGYGSTEAFDRAFRSVHGVSPGDVRRNGGPLRTQPQIRFRLTVEGNTPMDTRITVDPRSDSSDIRPECRSSTTASIHTSRRTSLRCPKPSTLASRGEQCRAEGAPPGQCRRDPDYAEGSELTYLHGVAVRERGRCRGPRRDRGYERHLVDFRTRALPGPCSRRGPRPQAIGSRRTPGGAARTFDRRGARPRRRFSTATTELWLPVERA